MAQQPIELILTRQWASYLTMPVFVADADGNLLYYNEAAEELLGRRFDEAGEMPLLELANIFQITHEDGSAMQPLEMPLGIALLERKPAHGRVGFKGLDGIIHMIEVTSFPLEGQGGRHLGALAIFWEVECS